MRLRHHLILLSLILTFSIMLYFLGDWLTKLYGLDPPYIMFWAGFLLQIGAVMMGVLSVILENKPFEVQARNVSQNLVQQALDLVKQPITYATEISKDDWIMCYVINQEFNGAGDPNRLEEILMKFLRWANHTEN